MASDLLTWWLSSSTPLTYMRCNDDDKMLSTTMRSSKELGMIWL